MFAHCPHYLIACVRKSKSGINQPPNLNLEPSWCVFRFVLMKIGFLLPLIFITSLPLQSLHFFNFWFHFSLHLINILYYVLYWSNGSFVGLSVGRTILVLFCMNVHCNQFNVFVLVYVYSFDWMQLWAVVRTRERVKKMIKRMVFLTDCNHARECIEQWSNKRMKCTQKKLNFKSFVWDEANG